MFTGTGLSCVSQENKTWKCHVNESSSFPRCLGYGPVDVMVSVLTHPFSPAFSCSYLGWGGECSLFLDSDSQMSYCFQYHSHWSSQHTTLEATCSFFTSCDHLLMELSPRSFWDRWHCWCLESCYILVYLPTILNCSLFLPFLTFDCLTDVNSRCLRAHLS